MKHLVTKNTTRAVVLHTYWSSQSTEVQSHFELSINILTKYKIAISKNLRITKGY